MASHQGVPYFQDRGIALKNAKFDTGDVKRVCEKKLSISFRSSGEFNGWFSLDGKKTARITIPKGKKPIPEKTYKSMAKQLCLSTDQFDDLLECPLKRPGYEEILRSAIGPQQSGNS